MNPPAVTIKLLADHPHHIASLAELRWREWAGHPGREHLRFWIEVTSAEAGHDTLPVTFVAVDQSGQVAGGVGLAPSDPPRRLDRGPWVVGTIVRADYRGAGVGTALMTHLQQWATRAGTTQLWVATGRPAVGFYRHCGWHATEVVIDDDGYPTTILTKQLRPTPVNEITATKS